MYYTSWSTCSHQPWSENNWENHSPNSSTNLQIGKSLSPIDKCRLSHWPINVAKSYFGRHMPHVWKKQCMPEKQTPSQQEKEPFWNCHGQSPHAQQSNSKLLFTNVHNHTQQTHSSRKVNISFSLQWHIFKAQNLLPHTASTTASIQLWVKYMGEL